MILYYQIRKYPNFNFRSRKLNCSAVFIGHRYFKNIDILKTLIELSKTKLVI